MAEPRTIRRRPVPQGTDTLPSHLHPVLRRVYLARHLTTASDLECSLKSLHSHVALHGMDAALGLLAHALTEGQCILVVADFDADGATSCALAIEALRLLGAREVRYVVPNRLIHGYGLTPEIVEVASRHQPDLLITVDNGISSHEGVAAARQRGMRVLITDHHLPGPCLPPADAIVNPNQPQDGFPSKHLAGVGVIFYVMLALRARLREQGWFTTRRPEPNMAQFLDLVALGTVADLVPLDRNNRILVSQGLARIRQGQARPGIAALLDVAGRSARRASTTDLGYFVGPRINAAGRLEDMSLGIECLLARDPSGARHLARELDRINRERRVIEADMQHQALESLLPYADGELPWGLCLFDPQWHPGVIGIVASRVKDRTHRPVIAFAPAADTELRGSARAIHGLHIRDTLEAVATLNPGLLTRFGGHAMAAGLTLPRAHLPEFTAAFDAEVRRRLDPQDLCGVILSDGELHAGELGLELAEALRAGGPWGQGFPEPVFDGLFDVVDQRVVGDKHLKLRVRLPDDAPCVDAIAFNAVERDAPTQAARLRLAYRLAVNEFRDARSAQLVVEYLEPKTGS